MYMIAVTFMPPLVGCQQYSLRLRSRLQAPAHLLTQGNCLCQCFGNPIMGDADHGFIVDCSVVSMKGYELLLLSSDCIMYNINSNVIVAQWHALVLSKEVDICNMMLAADYYRINVIGAQQTQAVLVQGSMSAIGNHILVLIV